MDRREDILRVIDYFLRRAEEDYFPIGIVRLTKLLYLLDVEYYRDHGRTYTGFKWMFYKYGPYTPEVEEVLSYAGINLEEEAISSAKVFRKVIPDRSRSIGPVGTEIENYLHRIWTEFGLESLPRLLDFVYFETEPMICARRGEVLDFSKVSKRETPKKITLSLEEKRKLREIAQSIREKLKRIPSPSRPVYPEEIYEVLRIWDEDEAADLGRLKGRVKIDISSVEK